VERLLIPPSPAAAPGSSLRLAIFDAGGGGGQAFMVEHALASEWGPRDVAAETASAAEGPIPRGG